MHRTQRDTTVTGTIHEVMDTAGVLRWVGAVAHPEDETPELLEQRWDAFARTMFRHGLEPVGDEPAFTTSAGGATTDHYALREVSELGGVGQVAAFSRAAQRADLVREVEA